MQKSNVYKLVLAGLFAAVGTVLPMVFHVFSISGSIFLPMHIPVLLCGLICGWKYGALVGIIVPFLSSIFSGGMPPLYPTALSMAIELAVYGLVIGLCYKKFNCIISLVISLIAGRIAMGIANVILLGIGGNQYAFDAFIASAFITALPGIIIQLILIPLIMLTLKKTNVLSKMN